MYGAERMSIELNVTQDLTLLNEQSQSVLDAWETWKWNTYVLLALRTGSSTTVLLASLEITASAGTLQYMNDEALDRLAHALAGSTEKSLMTAREMVVTLLACLGFVWRPDVEHILELIDEARLEGEKPCSEDISNYLTAIAEEQKLLVRLPSTARVMAFAHFVSRIR